MKFKEFRDLIFSPCYVVFGNMRCFVETHYDTDFDDYEVVGVRASDGYEVSNCIIVSLEEKSIVSNDLIDTHLDVYTSTRNTAQAEGNK